MKFIIALAALLLASPALAGEPEFPELTGRVVDAAHELSPEQIESMTAKLKAFEVKTHHQLVVVTVPTLGDVPKEEYAQKLGRKWGIGQKGADDGILLLQSPGDGKPGNGRLYIAVGSAIQGVLTDATAAGITRNIMVPILKGAEGSAGANLKPKARVPVALDAGVDELMRVSGTPEQVAETERRLADEQRRRSAGIRDFFENVLAFGVGILTLGAGGFGVWRLSTRKERARRKAELAERQRLAAIAEAEAAKARQLAAQREAEKRRAEEAAALKKREDMLAAMSPVARAAFLQNEEENRQRIAAAAAEQRRLAAERQRLEDERKRERQAEEDALARTTAASTSSYDFGSPSPSPAPDTSFSGGGGDFNGGGGGSDY